MFGGSSEQISAQNVFDFGNIFYRLIARELNPKDWKIVSAPQPIVTVLLAIVQNDSLLLIKRRKPPYRGLWGLAGGKVEFNESILEAAIREAREETGLDCNFDYVGCVASEVVYENGKPKHHFLFLVCRLHPTSFRVIESSEGTIKWFSLRELHKLQDTIIPSDLMFIKALIEENNRMCQFYEVEVTITPEGKCLARRI